MRLWNFKGEQNTISEALSIHIPDKAVICFTGGGGKTTLMISLARELASSGRKAVVTTTTHMADPGSIHAGDLSLYENLPVIYTDEPGYSSEDMFRSDLASAFEKGKIAMAVARDPEKAGKVMSPSQHFMDIIYEEADTILIEADGSRRNPLKWPAPWEPVIPDRTDITICVAGLSSLGRKTDEALFRSEMLPAPFYRDTIDENLIAAIVSSGEGGQKNAAGEFRVFLNQADNPGLIKSAEYIQRNLAVRGVQSAWGMLKNQS